MVAKMKTTVPHLPTGIATSNQCKDISHHPARIFVQSQVGKGKGAIGPITFFCHSLVGSHSTTYTASPFPPTLSQTLNTGQKTCSKAILHHGMNHLPQCIWMTSDGRSRSAQGLSRNIPDLPAQFEEGRFLFRFPIESREKSIFAEISSSTFA